MDRYRVAVVIPAYNEEATIDVVVSLALSLCQEVYVIDDCSSDSTAKLAIQAGATVIRNVRNLGYSRSIEKGLLHVSKLSIYDYMITVDADGQHPYESLKAIINRINSSAPDLIVGVRPNFARFSERLFSLYFRFVYGVIDPLCGLKAYRANTLKNHPKEKFNSIGTYHMARLLSEGRKCEQLAIKVEERSDQPRIGGSFKANFLILRSLIWVAIRN